MNLLTKRVPYLWVVWCVSVFVIQTAVLNAYAAVEIKGADDGTVRIFNPTTGEVVCEFQAGPGKVRETFLIKSQTLAIVSQENSTIVWDVNKNQMIRSIPRRVYAFSPNEARYVTYIAGPNGGLFVEDSKSFEILARLYSGEHGGPVRLRFSPEGRYLAVHFNSEYPLRDDEYPVPVLEHSVDWVELFDLLTNGVIEEFREHVSRYVGEFEGPFYYLRNSDLLLDGVPWDDHLRFLLEERRWESLGGRDQGMRRPEKEAALLSYDLYADVLGTDTKVGTVNINTYQTWQDLTSSGCLIQGTFDFVNTSPACCINWWQIVEATSWPLANCEGRPGDLPDPHIDSPYSLTYPHPRYNWPTELQYVFYDRPSGPKTRPTGSIQFESYSGAEEGELSKGTFYNGGSASGFRWGFDWDHDAGTVTLQPLTKAVELTEEDISAALDNSCFSTTDWSMKTQKPTNPCIEILEPGTCRSPVLVGPYTAPTLMTNKIRVGPDYTGDLLSGLTAGDFTIKVGGFPAAVLDLRQHDKYYKLLVQPPNGAGGIPGNGQYDLYVVAKKGFQEYKDVGTDAVEYGPYRGPQLWQCDIDMWQDNFPELGEIGPTLENPGAPPAYARCDMAQDMLPSTSPNIVPGDSLVLVAADDLGGLATDNTGGRPGKAVYVFVKCTDRFGVDRGYTAAQMQSPDNQAWVTDPNAGLLRWPFVPDLAPAGWYAYRLDQAYTTAGGVVEDTYCADLMDLAAGPDGPPYHPNENWAGNTGIFQPGDVIWYFFGAKNALGQWGYLGRALNGQAGWLRRNGIMDLAGLDAANLPKSACEWSVLPDAGRLPGDGGDILFVDDADDCLNNLGEPPQLYLDWAWKFYGMQDRVDRLDVLGSSSCVGNSLASRVKSVQNQMIGQAPWAEVYQKVIWNCSDLTKGLMGDGGVPNGGSSAEKSDDFALCNTFLSQHPDNPGWAYMGDDVVCEWNRHPIYGGALSVKATYMNHVCLSCDLGVLSPTVLSVAPFSFVFQLAGGGPPIHHFDVPGQAGLSAIAHKYNNATNGPPATLRQATMNEMGSTARFFLAGFGFDSIAFPRDAYLMEIIEWFQNVIGDPIGIDLVAFENRLDNNYPNPFNPTTTIKYSIADRGHVTLKVYNAVGQLVRTLINEEQAPQAGGFSKVWNGLNDHGQPVGSGVYFYQLTVKDFSQTKKMVVIK